MPPDLESSLTAAASAGDISQIRALLTTSQEPQSDETIQALITKAVRNSHLDAIIFLLKQYPSIPLNEEIVRATVNTGSIAIFTALLTRDLSIINMRFDRRGTPLVVAYMGHQRIKYLQFLLEAKVDPNQDPDAASFPLELVAALYNDIAVIDLLLQYGDRLERSGALSVAAQRGARAENDALAICTGTSLLHVAVRAGHVGVVRILLRHGGAPSDVAHADRATGRICRR
ncbi:ankyrin repeat-containing domain protein [Nemania sp. FL0031]|nr:ankyrin repeat-containing domain protein [Nemania sp. FL0031]